MNTENTIIGESRKKKEKLEGAGKRQRIAGGADLGIEPKDVFSTRRPETAAYSASGVIIQNEEIRKQRVGQGVQHHRRIEVTTFRKKSQRETERAS